LLAAANSHWPFVLIIDLLQTAKITENSYSDALPTAQDGPVRGLGLQAHQPGTKCDTITATGLGSALS
jgi:hypothetical protein